jgi:sugar phosphate isomerase/epimerase
MSFRFRQAICNEVFEKWTFADTCRAIHRAGYTGIEISPFTLAEDPRTITAAQRKEYRDVMASESLTFVGLHWLMVSPKGLHVTTPDDALRQRSWDHIRTLIDLCADLGPNGIMVFGSPAQRSTTGGSSVRDATRRWIDGFHAVKKQAEERGVTILVEALPKSASDVCNTLAEAVAIVDEVNSPAVRTMFDTHNAEDETEPHPVIVDRYFPYIRHVHVNEMDGRYPGTGNYDFRAVFQVLKRRNYAHWISLEVFDFKPGPVEIAERSLRYLESKIALLD